MTSSWMLVTGFLFAAAAMFVKIGSAVIAMRVEKKEQIEEAGFES